MIIDYTNDEMRCGCSSMVERNLPKVDVAGSSPVIRSKGLRRIAGLFAYNYQIKEKRNNDEIYIHTPRSLLADDRA